MAGQSVFQPSEVPQIRNDFRSHLRGVLARLQKTDGRSGQVEALDQVAEDAAANAPLYCVSSEMTELAVQAGSSLRTDFVIAAEDIPSPTGFLIFSKAIHLHPIPRGESPTVGAFWYPSGPQELMLIWLGDVHTNGPGSPKLPNSYLRSAGRVWVAGAENLITDGASTPDGHVLEQSDKGLYEHRSTLKATFLLMAQTLAAVDDVRVGRPGPGKNGRVARRPTVRVIRLRRAVKPAGDSAAEASREWQHQWMVRGHWRMQPWGPKRERVRPVWIAPHLKGPEGKPLLGGEKVYHLAR